MSDTYKGELITRRRSWDSAIEPGKKVTVTVGGDTVLDANPDRTWARISVFSNHTVHIKLGAGADDNCPILRQYDSIIIEAWYTGQIDMKATTGSATPADVRVIEVGG